MCVWAVRVCVGACAREGRGLCAHTASQSLLFKANLRACLCTYVCVYVRAKVENDRMEWEERLTWDAVELPWRNYKRLVSRLSSVITRPHLLQQQRI